ncbi:hypothetical protein ACQY0O_005785 [Thecaphora frezii]
MLAPCTRAACASFAASVRTKSTQASSRAAAAMATAPKPPRVVSKVVYRAPPGMRRGLYYFMGCVFTGASAYQAYILTQHMSWPLFSRDLENNPPKLAPAPARYTASAAILFVGGTLGLFMFWSPTRLATRVTLYPATSQVGVRTCAPPFRTYLPRSLQSDKKGAPLSPHDSRERLHDFTALLRRDNTSAVEIAASVEGKARRVVRADGKGFRRIPSSLLLCEGNTWGYQLEAAPRPKNAPEVKNLYKKGWEAFQLWIKGTTDWSVPHGATGLSPVEQKAKEALHPKEPWFFDRDNFDRLFPVRGRN